MIEYKFTKICNAISDTKILVDLMNKKAVLIKTVFFISLLKIFF